MKELWTLFITFCRIGGLTFGGGYAMLPMLQKEVVERYGWATEEELIDYYAIGQCTPGIIAVNTATFIGYKRKKTAGAIAATLGVIFPSLVIIMVIAAFIRNFQSISYVQHAFAGIRVAVCALIVDAVIKLWKNGIKNKIGLTIFIVVLSITILTSILPGIKTLSPIYFILSSALLGIILGKMGVKQ